MDFLNLSQNMSKNSGKDRWGNINYSILCAYYCVWEILFNYQRN